VFASTAGHAAAPLVVYTILAGPGNDLGNGWERARLGDGAVGLYDRENATVWLLRPPTDTYDRCTIALDGTPTPEMWNLALGENLEHREVLDEDERRRYVRDALNLQVVRTTDAIKPYNSDEYVAVDRDGALLEAVRDEHGQRPDRITTATARDEYDAAGLLELVDDTQHYGNVLGSNRLGDSRLGVAIGSNHYGDGFVERWGAYANRTVERGEGKGAELSYGAFGDRVLTHMREHETLQAVMRFGRDGNGAVVYAHTDTLPEWVPWPAGGGA
jgi:hypothetical protein